MPFLRILSHHTCRYFTLSFYTQLLLVLCSLHATYGLILCIFIVTNPNKRLETFVINYVKRFINKPTHCKCNIFIRPSKKVSSSAPPTTTTTSTDGSSANRTDDATRSTTSASGCAESGQSHASSDVSSASSSIVIPKPTATPTPTLPLQGNNNIDKAFYFVLKLPGISINIDYVLYSYRPSIQEVLATERL